MNGPPFKPQRIDHLVLRVRDGAAMQAFYCDVLGCTLERRQDEIGLVQLRAGASLIDLVDVEGKLGRIGGSAPGPEGRNLDHLCLRVEPFDREAIAAYLQSRGVAPGEQGSRYGAEGEGPSQYLADPEGNIVELKGPAVQTAEAAAAPASPAPVVMRVLDVMKREPVLFVTLGYVFISFIGLWASFWFYRRFGLPVLEYMQAGDFLVAGLREPVYVLVLLAMLAFAWLVTWPELWRKRHPERVDRLRRTWWGRFVFPKNRIFRWIGAGMTPETGMVFGFFWGAIWLLFAYVIEKAEDIHAGGGEAVAVTMLSENRTLPGEIRLLGTSSAFVFLWWPRERRAEAVPIESIGRIASAAPASATPSPKATLPAKAPAAP